MSPPRRGTRRRRAWATTPGCSATRLPNAYRRRSQSSRHGTCSVAALDAERTQQPRREGSLADVRPRSACYESEALCRTRTGDPFLTMAAGRTPALPHARPKRLHSPRNTIPQTAASIRTFRHPPVPRGTLGLARARSAWTLLAGSAQSALRRQPPCRLARDCGDAVVVLVVVQNGDIRRFRGRRDQQVGVFHRALRRAALGTEPLVDLQRALPLVLADRAVGQRGELLPNLRELGQIG